MRLSLIPLAGFALSLISIAACETSSGNANADQSSSSSSGSSGTSSGSSGTEGPDAAPAPDRLVIVTPETMEFDGKTRHYFLAKPKDYDASKTYPLVMSFHGDPGNAEGQMQGLPFDSVSKTAAVIVYPQGWDDSWDLYTPTDTNRDMNFIKALVDEVKTKKANIDKAKVLGFGYSGGGFFVAHFACRFAGVFKAISVNSGGGPDETEMGFTKKDNGCYDCPGGPIPTIVSHGQADTNVDYTSGAFTAACYADGNGCKDTRAKTSPTPCEQYDGCPADKPVKWCLIPDQGHGVWGEAMKEAWAFFNALP